MSGGKDREDLWPVEAEGGMEQHWPIYGALKSDTNRAAVWSVVNLVGALGFIRSMRILQQG